MPMALMVTMAVAGVTAHMADGMSAPGIRVYMSGLGLGQGYIPVIGSLPEFMDLLHTVTTRLFRGIGKDDWALTGKEI